MVKFSQLFAKIQLENIENFDENQLSVFQGKIGQFSKLFAKVTPKIMRNLEKKKLTSDLPRFTSIPEVKKSDNFF